MSSTDERGLMTATLGVLSVVALCGYFFLAARLGLPFAIPVGIIGSGAAAFALKGPIGQAIARRMDGRDHAADETAGQLLGEIDELRGRMQELEERVDFSERLLAQQPRTPES